MMPSTDARCHARRELRRITLLETVWKFLGTSQPPHHQAYHRRIDECLAGGAQPLVVLAHPAVVAQPSERPLRNPPTRQDLEASARHQPLPLDLSPLLCPFLRPDPRDLLGYGLRGTMHDLDAQAEHFFCPLLASSLVTGVHPQMREAWKVLTCGF